MKVQTISGVNFGKVVFLSVLVVMLLAVPLPAQVSTGTILGVVKDASGGVVAGATITATNEGTAQAQTVTSGSDGAYRFSALSVGHYTVKTEASGFKTLEQKGLVLDVATTVVVNAVLEVGAAAQEVTVTGEAPLVNTSTSSLGGLVDEQRMAELPLNGRNYSDLTLLQSGVTQHANIGTSAGLAGLWFSSNGAPVISNFFTLDGAPTNTQMGGGSGSYAGTTLGVDGIREYKVITNTFSAEYGMTMGSQVVMVSKGGTNQFHGDAFDYLRNSALDARNFFDYGYLSGGHRLPEFKRNNFGAAGGGPIKKDKTFFFGVYEGLRQNQGFTALDATLGAGCQPTTANGGVITYAACPQIGSSTPPITVPAVMDPLLALYPAPSPGLTNQFSFGTSNTTSVNYGQMRVDQNFSTSDMFFARYTIDNALQNGADPANINTDNGVAFPQIRAVGQSREQFLSLVETHIFSPSLLNSARVSFSRTNLVSSNLYPDTALLSAPYSFVPGFGMGGLTVSGLSVQGGSTTGGDPLHPVLHVQNIYTFGDDLSKTTGKHALKFGILINRFNQGVKSSFNEIGAVTFGSVATFLEGYPLTLSSVTPGSDLNRDWIYNTAGFYAQDDWRMTSRLTVNLGLRYEFMTTPHDLTYHESRIVNFLTPFTPPAVDWSFGPPINNKSFRNFSPRVGFAWDVTGKGKTSVRGGAGLFFDIGNLGEYFDQGELTIPPYSSTTTVTYPSSSTQVLTLPITNSYTPQNVGTALHTADYNYNSPHLLQYNLTVEQQLPGHIGLAVSYVGSRGWSLNSPNSNFNLVTPTAVINGQRYWDNSLVNCESTVPSCREDPGWGSVTMQTTDGVSWYNSLQVVVTKRMSRGLQFQGAWTYAQDLDTGVGALVSAECSSSGADVGINPQDRLLDRGPSCFDVRNNLRFNMLYQFPNLKSNGFASKLANGWWMGTIVSVQSGYAFTPTLVTMRANDNMLTYASAGNATVAPGQTANGQTNNTGTTFVPFNAKTVITGNPNQWFNPNMFMLAPAITTATNPTQCPGTITPTNLNGDICQTTGNVGRDTLRGPGLGTWNFSLVKDTALRSLGESGTLEFRAEFFNLLNRANFAMPIGTVFTGSNKDISSYSEAPLGGPAGAGVITTTNGSSRQIQFALKLMF